MTMLAALGPSWMDPAWLLERFGTQFFIIALLIVLGVIVLVIVIGIALFLLSIYSRGALIGTALPVRR